MATFSPPGAGTSITADKLNDSNYILWSKGVEFYLIAQGKVSALPQGIHKLNMFPLIIFHHHFAPLPFLFLPSLFLKNLSGKYLQILDGG